MDMSQMRYGSDDTYITSPRVATAAFERASPAPPPAIRAAAATAYQAARAWPRPSSACRPASLSVTGASSRAAAVGQLRRAPRRPALQLRDAAGYNMAAVGGFGPPAGSRPVSACEADARVHGRRHLAARASTSRPRSPAPTPTSRTSACRACSTAASSGRAARAPTARPTRRIVSIDASSIAHIPGAQVVQKGNFLGVVAPHEYDAIQAAAQLKVDLAERPGPRRHRQPVRARCAPRTTSDAVQASLAGNVDRRPRLGGRDADRAELLLPLQRPLRRSARSAASPTSAPTGATIYSNTQDIDGPRTDGRQRPRPASRRRCGAATTRARARSARRPTDDVAEAAAIMSQLVGKPVRLQFMRWDEHGWDNYGPAHMVDLTAGIDAHGNIVGYSYVAGRSRT